MLVPCHPDVTRFWNTDNPLKLMARASCHADRRHASRIREGHVGHPPTLSLPRAARQAPEISLQGAARGVSLKRPSHLVQLAWWLALPRLPLATVLIGRTTDRALSKQGIRPLSSCTGPNIHPLLRQWPDSTKPSSPHGEASHMPTSPEVEMKTQPLSDIPSCDLGLHPLSMGWFPCLGGKSCLGPSRALAVRQDGGRTGVPCQKRGKTHIVDSPGLPRGCDHDEVPCGAALSLYKPQLAPNSRRVVTGIDEYLSTHICVIQSLLLAIIMRWLLDRPTAAYCIVLALLQIALGSPVQPNPVVDLQARQTIIPGGKPCGQNNATNRGCWKNNWNINTDYETTTPPAFNTRVVCPLLLPGNGDGPNSFSGRLPHHQRDKLARP
jgi:hypothetical protein